MKTGFTALADEPERPKPMLLPDAQVRLQILEGVAGLAYKARAEDVLDMAEWVLSGQRYEIVEAEIVDESDAQWAKGFASLMDELAVNDPEPGVLKNVQDLARQTVGTIIQSADGQTIECIADKPDSIFRWVLSEPREDQPYKSMQDGEVVIETKGPWKIVDPTPL